MDKEERKETCPHQKTIIENVEGIKHLRQDIKEIKTDTKEIKNYTEKIDNGELSRDMLTVTQNLAQAIIDNQSEQRKLEKEEKVLENESDERDFKQVKMELEYKVKFWRAVVAILTAGGALFKLIEEWGWIF